MRSFVKTSACPPAETLLAYAADRLAPGEYASVSRHLSCCDHCGAAQHLLTKHPPVLAAAPAPPPLLVLLLAGQLPSPTQSAEPVWQPRAA
ncbi:MAG TPA: hypothetical protein VF525_16000 [Pyrinomonadaceae bacterium]|jgi:anti-sigma factor ChrR (cupin superfamily)